MVEFGADGDFVGRSALREIAERGVDRLLTGVRIGGEPILGNPDRYPVFREGDPVGQLTSVVFWPRFRANIGFVLGGC